MAKKTRTAPPVSQSQAEEAVRTLLRWAGDDPARAGLRRTPRRVVEAYREWFAGYAVDPREYLRSTLGEVSGGEMVVVRDLDFESHCEHHLAPFTGRAHVGYLPRRKVAGISRLAHVVDAYARRLQVQEQMTAEIARCIDEMLQPRGVGVVIEATHHCMATLDARRRGVSVVTSTMLGAFRDEERTRSAFFACIDVHGRG